MTWWVVGVSIATAAASAYNTQQVKKNQDQSAANSIMEQARLQRQADSKVDRQVNELEGSSAQDERAGRMGEYLDALRLTAPGRNNGLVTNIGSSAFQGDSAQAANDVQDAAVVDAALLSRIDAPVLQRQGEAFGYGNLATDIGLIGRQSQGQAFMDGLRMKSIKRNPWIDAAATAANAYAGSASAGGGYKGSAGKQPYMSNVPTDSAGNSWLNAYGAG